MISKDLRGNWSTDMCIWREIVGLLGAYVSFMGPIYSSSAGPLLQGLMKVWVVLLRMHLL